MKEHSGTAWARSTCRFDSGSMYGNVPLCDKPATHLVVWDGGRNYGPTARTPVCAGHVVAMQGVAHPGHIRTERLAGGSSNGGSQHPADGVAGDDEYRGRRGSR